MDELCGLVVCGGQSSRMGTDKSMLEYHGLPHRYYLFTLLQNFCKSVYLSVNSLQSKSIEKKYSSIVDVPEYHNTGPMTALLSAWKKFPEVSWLVIGCDYPFIDKETLEILVKNRKGQATCFLLPEENIIEPLLTIYESSFYSVVMKYFYKQDFSLSRILKKEKAKVVRPSTGLYLQNVNTLDEYHTAKKLINNQMQ